MNFKDCFVDSWRFNRIPNNQSGYIGDGGRVVAYNTITEELRDELDSLYDDGSALITNAIKIKNLHYIAGVDRTENETIWKSDNDELSKLLYTSFMDSILPSIGVYKWPPEPNCLYPIYTTGTRYIPDAMIGLIDDVCIQYDTKHCMYAIMLTDNAYDTVCRYYKHFRSMLKDVMKCKNVDILVKNKTLVLSDRNKGAGPDIDRANALGCAVMFIILNIVQLLQLEE